MTAALSRRETGRQHACPLWVRTLFVGALSWVALQADAAGSATVVLEDLRVIDGVHAGPLQHMDVLIRGERIIALLPHDEGTRPPSARRIKLSGKTVLPGLISDHSHVGLVDGTQVGGKNATRQNILRQLHQYEAYGVTSVTSLGLNMPVFYELQPLLHRGALPGADLFGADRGIGAADGAPPSALGISDQQVYRPQSPEAARAAVRDSATRHPDLLKIWVDDMHGSVRGKLTPEIYRAIIEEAHVASLRVAAHVFYLEDARALVAAGVDILAHGVRDQPVDADFIRAMQQHGVWYVPTLALDESTFAYAERTAWTLAPAVRRGQQPALAAQLDDEQWRTRILSDEKSVTAAKQALAVNLRNLKSLYDAGVHVGFGTDSGANPLRIAGVAEHRELQLLTQAGLTPMQAIGTATVNAAQLLQLADRGTLAPGKLADLLIVEGEPDRDISDIDQVVAVWHRGRQVAGPLTAFSP